MIKFILKIAGKDQFKLDKNISNMYIVHLCMKYGLMMLRGIFFCACRFKKYNKFFKGARVKIICSNRLWLGSNVKLHDDVYIDALSIDNVYLSDNVVLGRNSRIECTGSINHVGKGVKIGDNTSFGSDCFFGAAGGIEIGNNVIAGQNIRFHSENHIFDSKAELIKNQGVSHFGIKVGDNCWIGAGAVFLDGAEIGAGTVVGANSVVTKRFPGNVVIAGIPAKIIRRR